MPSCLQGSCQLLQSYTNMNLGVRLGLLSPDNQQLLLMHSRRYSSSSASSRERLALQRPSDLARGDSLEEELSLLRMTAGNTLLKDAVDRKVARFLRNTAAYLEVSMTCDLRCRWASEASNVDLVHRSLQLMLRGTTLQPSNSRDTLPQ